MSSNQKILSDIQKFRLEVLRVAKNVGFTEAARIYNLERHTISRWEKRFKKDGVDGLLNSSRVGNKHPNRMDKSVERGIVEYKKSNPNATAEEIKRVLNLPFTLKTILKRLSQNGISSSHKSSDSYQKKIRVEKESFSFNRGLLYITIEQIEHFEKELPKYQIIIFSGHFYKPYIIFSNSNDDLSISSALDYFLGHYLNSKNSKLKSKPILAPLRKSINNHIDKRNSFLKHLLEKYTLKVDWLDRKEREFFRGKLKLFTINPIQRDQKVDSVDDLIVKSYTDLLLKFQKEDIEKPEKGGRWVLPLIPPIMISSFPQIDRGEAIVKGKTSIYKSSSNQYFKILVNYIKERGYYLKDRDPKNGLPYLKILLEIIKPLKIYTQLKFETELEIEKVKLTMGSIFDVKRSVIKLKNRVVRSSYDEVLMNCYKLLGEIELRFGNHKRGLYNFKKGILIAKNLKIEEEIHLFNLNIGKGYIISGNNSAGRDIFIKLYRISSREGVVNTRVSSLIEIAKIAISKGEAKKGFHIIEYAENLAENSKLYHKLTTIYQLIVPFYTNFYSGKGLDEKIEKMERLLPIIEYSAELYTSLLNSIAYANISLNRYQESMSYLTKVLLKAEEADLFMIRSSALVNIGVQYIGQNKQKRGLKYYQKSLEISDRYNLPWIGTITTLNLAKHYYIHNNNIEALKYGKRSLALSKQINLKRNIIDSLVTISMSLIRGGDIDSADKTSKTLIWSIKNYNHTFFLGCYYNIKGIISTFRKRYSESNNYYKKSLKLMKSAGNYYYLSEICYYFALSKYYQGEIEEGYQLLKEADHYSSTVHMLHIQKDCKKLLKKFEKFYPKA